jgi:hypothetical protein
LQDASLANAENRLLYQVPVIRTYGPSPAVRWT